MKNTRYASKESKFHICEDKVSNNDLIEFYEPVDVCIVLKNIFMNLEPKI